MAFTIQTSMSKSQMLDQYELILLLNPNLKQEQFEESIEAMCNFPYKMLGVFEGEKCVGICGYWVMTKLYSGKYLELDNVVVAEAYRSAGIGKLMSDEMERIALAENCKVMMLDAYIPNVKAHEFYERLGFEKRGYHFIKKIVYPSH
jgi:ribosomal protein S18 acetylase RimI-like enzyme